LKPKPFYNAFELKVAYIEADVFLEDGKLLVAHTKRETDPSKTLESMYLEPLSQKVKEGNGKLYGVTLMIDLKTSGAPTMDVLVKTLDKYPDLTKCEGLSITMSGDYPPPSQWKNYPAYITFDGRPNVSYSADEVKQVRLVSTSFGSVSGWDGNGEIPSKDKEKIKQAVDWAHQLNKPMRFWASPDFPNAWAKFKEMGVDIFNSDNINELSKYLSH
ncbi:MAG TPA: glycerophosphodiester phosphodiesterase, partial [Cyclobacteriaceae bacterium]